MYSYSDKYLYLYKDYNNWFESVGGGEVWYIVELRVKTPV
jgi:hypothetical protein